MDSIFGSKIKTVMSQISSFQDLKEHLQKGSSRKKMAVANAVDAHSLEAVMMAVKAEIVEAYLIGDAATISNYEIIANDPSEFVHIIDMPDVHDATLEAVRMVRAGECDILMKGPPFPEFFEGSCK